MGVVHEPIEDAVSQSGVADLLVPARHRQLRSQDCGARLWGMLKTGHTRRTFIFESTNPAKCCTTSSALRDASPVAPVVEAAGRSRPPSIG